MLTDIILILVLILNPVNLHISQPALLSIHNFYCLLKNQIKR